MVSRLALLSDRERGRHQLDDIGLQLLDHIDMLNLVETEQHSSDETQAQAVNQAATTPSSCLVIRLQLVIELVSIVGHPDGIVAEKGGM